MPIPTRYSHTACFLRNWKSWIVFSVSLVFIVALSVVQAESGTSVILSASKWTPIGPAPGMGGGPFSGRIDVAAADPSDSNVMYVGSTNGGVWKTTNWLDTKPDWTELTDQPQVLSLAIHEHDLVMFPGNPNIVLAAATGPGGGILRSENGGTNWSFLANSHFDLAEFSALVVDPNVANAQKLYVAVSGGSTDFIGGSGVYKSTDGGATWSNAGSAAFSGFVSDLIQLQENGQTVLYAADPATGGVFRSDNGGTSWQAKSLPANANGYETIHLAGGTAPTEQIYAAAIDNSSSHVSSRFFSSDMGANWSQLAWPDAPGPDSSASSTSHRVHHNLLAVDPANSSTVFVNTDLEANLLTLNPDGSEKYGEFIWKSYDSGQTWQPFGGGGDPVSGTFDRTGVFVACGDNGIYRNSIYKGNNLNTVPFYSFSLDPKDPRIAFGVMQDAPGTLKYTGDLVWRYVQPSPGQGEAGKIRVDPTNPNRVYYLDPNTRDPVSAPTAAARFVHSDDGGKTWQPAITGLPNDSSNKYTDFAFYGKNALLMDPNNPQRLLLGLRSVFETTTGGDPNGGPNFGGNGWRDIGANMGNNGHVITAIAMAPSDPNAIYAGTDDGRIFRTTNAGAASPAWNPVDNFANPLETFNGQMVMDMQVDPADANHVFAVTSAWVVRDAWVVGENTGLNLGGDTHVWVHAGGAWASIQSNVPKEYGGDSITVDWQPPAHPQTPRLYLGTQRGAFGSDNLGATWTRFDSFPRTRITELEFAPDIHLIGAGTLGRGAWETLTQSTPPAITPPGTQMSAEATSHSFDLGSFSDPDGGPWTVDVNWGDGSTHTSFDLTSPGSLGAKNHTYKEEGPFTVTITVTDTLDGQADSKTFAVSVSDQPVNATGGFTIEVNVGTDTGPQAVATFTDPAGAEPNASDPAPTTSAGHYTASIDWGDGTKSPGSITPLTPSSLTQQFTVTGSHTYTTQSPVSGFNVITTIDHEGVTSMATSTAIVGHAGKVTGDGQIGDGQIGDGLTFSFDAQPDGTNSFKGTLNYADKTNNIDLKSTSITFVSILSDNEHATLKGTATVNGTSGYTFRVDMQDNGEPGIGVDRFRIRLSGPTSYDSNAFAANGGLLTAGNIQVHM